ncbi:uncharacterized protein TM35_000901050 [Trypanosoma theileri]|uniref:Mucin TcMUCII n=1 Tax=Trypanosoma theileri TaxID=67003 RepID=A0A1X0NF60_9TRYP|nr:uncharacterized protein TM35_000901050 [Trypanosoma theileri]ORC82507.1 hypothetical protein TM35_000901050 [Trypanosoma theileri]
MMMMGRVMCVLAVVLCCTCGYTMAAAAAAVDVEWDDFLNDTSNKYKKCKEDPNHKVDGINCEEFGFAPKAEKTPLTLPPTRNEAEARPTIGRGGDDTESQAAEGIDRQGQQPGSNPTRTENDAGEREPEPTESSKRPGNVEVPQGEQGASSSTDDNSTAGNSNATQQQSPVTVNTTATSGTHETNSTTPQSPESNVTDAPTTTPSPVPVTDTQISNITSALQNRPNVDSSISPVWMRNAAPLLIVAVLFSATVY